MPCRANANTPCNWASSDTSKSPSKRTPSFPRFLSSFPQAAPRMKILSVDDKAENLYMLEALLRGHGHEVDSASNGLIALQLAERGVYDLIISDILMPRMDGFQLCRELKKDTRMCQIPFIFYTATYTDPRDAAFALSLGRSE